MPILYRPAIVDDKPELDECLQQIVSAERTMDSCLRDSHIEYYDPIDFVIDEEAMLFVALEVDQHKERIVGCGAARIQSAKPYYRYESSLHLAMMYVAQSHRGQGINGVIMKKLLTWGKAQGVTNAKLTVYPNNPSAIRAYEKLGFEPALVEMRLRSKDE